MLVDLLVIGGGINGAAIASDASGRNLSVVLCEKDDLAFATSSSSSKLIHGGLRYLEQYNFHMVRESLREREILMFKAPFLVRPIEFVIPHNKSFRSQLTIRMGLWFYDLLYWHRTLPRSRKLNLRKVVEGNALRGEYKTGYSYFDCWTDDARLVVLNAISARDRGAHILTRTECESLQRYDDYWEARLHDKLRNQTFTIKAKVVVNAAGPWVAQVMKNIAHIKTKSHLRPIQGSHIVVPKLFEGRQAYTLQNPDGRVVFVVPFKNIFTLIGTTEVPYDGDPNLAGITNNEINYLCDTVNRYFENKINSEDIVWSYSGVRPLFDDKSKKPHKISREFHLDLNTDGNQAPIISVFGGKLTTHRILAEKVMNELKPYFPDMGPPWTEKMKLPGGHCDGLNMADFIVSLEKQYDWLPIHIVHRYAKLYGDLCHTFLEDCRSLDDLGHHFGGGFYEKELFYLVKNEWAKKVDDVLWRRTKLGLYLEPEKVKALKEYFNRGL